MKKEIQQTDPNVLLKFAHLLGTEVKDGRLEIPQSMAKGIVPDMCSMNKSEY